MTHEEYCLEYFIFHYVTKNSRAGAIEVFWVSGHPLPGHLSNCTVYSRLRLIGTHLTPNLVPIIRSSQLSGVNCIPIPTRTPTLRQIPLRTSTVHTT